MALTLLIGGRRSGKSRLAVRMAEAWAGSVAVIATGEPRDAEMAERIRRHRIERSPSWLLVEEPVDLGSALARIPDESYVVLDCLTLWTSNVIERGLSDAEIEKRAGDAASCAAVRGSPTVVVTNEVGSGIVPANELARRYADVLGRVNAVWGEASDRVLLVVCGLVVPLADPAHVLGARFDA